MKRLHLGDLGDLGDIGDLSHLFCIVLFKSIWSIYIIYIYIYTCSLFMIIVHCSCSLFILPTVLLSSLMMFFLICWLFIFLFVEIPSLQLIQRRNKMWTWWIRTQNRWEQWAKNIDIYMKERTGEQSDREKEKQCFCFNINVKYQNQICPSPRFSKKTRRQECLAQAVRLKTLLISVQLVLLLSALLTELTLYAAITSLLFGKLSTFPQLHIYMI